MATLSLDGKQVSFTDRGDGPPIVLLHAGASSGKQWNKISAILEAKYRLIAPDLWGFGSTASWSSDQPLTHDDQARLVDAVVDASVNGRVHLVGHSYGGGTAVRFALMRIDRLLSLTLIEPVLVNLLRQPPHEGLFAEYREVADTFLRAASEGAPEKGWARFLDYRNGAGTWAKLSPEAKNRFIATTKDVVVGYGSNLNNLTTPEDLGRISVPTLVLCGERTTLPERRVTEIVRDYVPACRYEVVLGAEHMSPITHPEAVAAFIDRHVGNGAF